MFDHGFCCLEFFIEQDLQVNLEIHEWQACPSSGGGGSGHQQYSRSTIRYDESSSTEILAAYLGDFWHQHNVALWVSSWF